MGLVEICNGVLKWCFAAPRPTWTNTELICTWLNDHEFSFPSSHSTICSALAVFFSRSWGVTWPHVLAVAISISRIVEGAHWPHDVFAGWLLGTSFSEIYVRLLPSTVKFCASVMPAVLVLGGLLAIFALTVVIHKLSRSLKRPLPAAWVKAAKTKVELDPFGRPLKAYYGMLGCLGGLFLCEPTFEPFPQKLSGRRFFAGLAILLSIFLSL